MWNLVHVMCSLILSDSKKTPTFPADFREFSNIKFNQNPYSGSRNVPWGETNGRTKGRTDRRDESNSNFSQFCERASNVTRFQGTCVKATAYLPVAATWKFLQRLFTKLVNVHYHCMKMNVWSMDRSWFTTGSKKLTFTTPLFTKLAKSQ